LTRTDGGKVTADSAEASGLASREGREWQTDLSSVDWRRGEYRIRVALHARPDGPELAAEAATLRFQPPAPALTLRLGGRALATTEQTPLAVNDDTLTFDVVLAAPAGQEVEVQFAQLRN